MSLYDKHYWYVLKDIASFTFFKHTRKDTSELELATLYQKATILEYA